MTNPKTPAELRAMVERMKPGPLLYRCKSESFHRPSSTHRFGERVELNDDDFEGFAALRNKAEALVELWEAAGEFFEDEASHEHNCASGYIGEKCDCWVEYIGEALDRLAGGSE